MLAVLLADLSAQERVVLRRTTHDISYTTSDISHTISQHDDIVENSQETVDRGKETADSLYSCAKVVCGTQDMCNEIVEAILDARTGDAQMLADLCDRDGRKAVDIATPLCKTLLLACTQLCGRYSISLNPPEHRTATSVVLRAVDHSPHDFSDTFNEFDRNKNGALEPKELAEAAQSLGICAKLLQVTDQAVLCAEFVSACKKLIGDRPRQVFVKLMQYQAYAGPNTVAAGERDARQQYAEQKIHSASARGPRPS